MVLSVLAIVFVIYYVALSILSPVKTYRTLSREWQLNDSLLAVLIHTNKIADSAMAVNAWLQSKVKLTDYDSIYLTLNLADSLLNLELQGIVIHNVKVKKIRYSKMLRNFTADVRYSYLSAPFTINHYHSTIPKVPIVVKQAPRDTAEANKINTAPEMPKEDYVHYTLDFDRQLSLTIDQLERPQNRHFFVAFGTRAGKKWKYFKNIMTAGVRFRVPEYRLWIRIEIPASDAKTIFRALPENAPVVVRL